jgi:leader peptidase (prepilin peptidase)/N-methyltransferase
MTACEVLFVLAVNLPLGGLAGLVVRRLSGDAPAWRPWWPSVGLTVGQAALALWASAVASEAWPWDTWGLAWALLVLAAVDLTDLRLPDILTLPLLVAGLAVGRGEGGQGPVFSALSAVVAYLAFRGLAWVHRRWRGVDGLGQGDAKLLAAAGAWLGWPALPSVVLGACLPTLAAVLPARLLAWARDGGMGAPRPVPFGPGLCLAIWVVWLYGRPVP